MLGKQANSSLGFFRTLGGVWLGALCVLLGGTLANELRGNFEGDVITVQGTSSTPFTSVNFRQTFDRAPIVFAMPTVQGGDPATIRVRNVTTTGFEITTTEPLPEDGPHTALTNVTYLAIQPGLYEIEPGVFLDAGVWDTMTTIQGSPPFASAGGYDNVEYRQDFGSGPAILGQIQTINNELNNIPTDPSSPFLATTSIINQGTNNFDISMERAEVDDGSVLTTNETLGYLALQDTTGSFTDNATNTIDWEAFISSDSIEGWDDGLDTINFNNSYSSAPLVTATLATRDGPNGGWLRSGNISNTGIQLTVDEDRYFDPERNHTTERASIAAFSQAFDATLIRRNITITWNGQDAAGSWQTPSNWRRWNGNDRNLQFGDSLLFNNVGSGVTTSFVNQNYTPDLAGILFEGSTPYTINGNGGSLNLQNFGSITNDSSALQTIDVDINGKGTYTIIDAGDTAGGSLFFGPNSTIDLSDTGGVTAVVIGSNDTEIQSVMAGTDGALWKAGSGTLTVSGTNSNTYAGITQVFAGTLALNKSGGATAVAGDVVLTGGTLLLQQSDQIADTSNMTLGNAIFDTDGNSDTLGTLTLSGSSTIDLGSGSSVLAFADSSAQTWSGSITIEEWDGSTSGGGIDQIFFGNSASGLTSGQVSQIQFVNPAGFAPGTYGAQMLASGELVPVNPVPEPGTWLGGTMGLIAIAWHAWRKRGKSKVTKSEV